MTQQAFEQAKARHDKLREQRISVEADLRTAQTRVAEIAETLTREYGTSNLRDLKAELDRREAANEAARKAFLEALEKTEQKLAEAEQGSANGA